MTSEGQEHKGTYRGWWFPELRVQVHLPDGGGFEAEFLVDSGTEHTSISKAHLEEQVDGVLP